MTKFYSHSKISAFEQCPLKFKLRYIDKIIPDVEKSIEAHLGTSVHAALEWLYLEVKKKRIPTLDELLLKYKELWDKDFNENFVIVKKDLKARDYFEKGIQFILYYYPENHPFKDNTIDVEQKIILSLDENEEYKIYGFIDRLSYNLRTKEYEIHDYKTANNLPPKESFKKDRQLALYSIAIKEKYGKDTKVKLVWHYLAHKQKVQIKKTNEELEILKQDTLRKIKVIEKTDDFPGNKTRLCDWCEYKSICPAWGNTPPQKPKKEKQVSLDKYPTISKYIKD